MTRRQKRLLKKQEQVRVQEKQAKGSFLSGARVIGFIVLVGVIGVTVYGVVRSSGSTSSDNSTPSTTYTDAEVHWHAAFGVELCGVKQDFLSYGVKQHAGSALLHTHGDGLIHIEGRVIKKEDIALGRFFDGIDVAFDRDRIMDKKNGDTCPNTPDKPGSVKMLVNDMPNDQFRDFVGQYTSNGEDTRIRIVFD